MENMEEDREKIETVLRVLTGLLETAAGSLDDYEYRHEHGLNESALKFAVLTALPIASETDGGADHAWISVVSELALMDDPAFGDQRVSGWTGQRFADLVLGHPTTAGVDYDDYLPPLLIELKYDKPKAISFGGQGAVATAIRRREKPYAKLTDHANHGRYNPYLRGFSDVVLTHGRTEALRDATVRHGDDTAAAKTWKRVVVRDQLVPYMQLYASREDVREAYGGRRLYGVVIHMLCGTIGVSGLECIPIDPWPASDEDDEIEDLTEALDMSSLD